MTSRVLALLMMVGAVASTEACGLPLQLDAAEISNECTNDEACGQSGRCIEQSLSPVRRHPPSGQTEAWLLELR